MLISSPKKVDESGAKPVAILLTHGHFDHATDAKPLADRYGIKIYIHEADKATLDDPQLNVSYMMGQSKTFYADVFFRRISRKLTSQAFT